MKVKELIEGLNKLNQELEIWVWDEVERNDCRLSKIEVHKNYTCWDGTENPKKSDVVMLRWN